LLDRLSTDRSIAPLVAQFVPLKVETDGPNWGQWASKYRHEGSGIPILYVIRADGEKLYAKSGAKAGDELPRFLVEHLRAAGTIFSDQQLATIKTVVEDANKALGEGDTLTAVKRLESLRKLGTPGKLASYAGVCQEADALYVKVVEQGKAALQDAQQKLAADDKFAGTLGIISANRIYGSLPDLRKELATAERDLNKNAELKALLPPAEALDRGLALAVQKSPQLQKQAITTLGRVVTQHPNSPAAELAKAKLAELGAEAPASAIKGNRTWTDATGSFKVEAELVRVVDGKVELRKPDGTVIAVPLDRLSTADRAIATGK
jgi:hypothetical protein